MKSFSPKGEGGGGFEQASAAAQIALIAQSQSQFVGLTLEAFLVAMAEAGVVTPAVAERAFGLLRDTLSEMAEQANAEAEMVQVQRMRGLLHELQGALAKALPTDEDQG